MKGWRLFYVGAVAGAVAVGASLLVRLLFNGTYLPEMASDAVFSLVPGFLESQAVEKLGPDGFILAPGDSILATTETAVRNFHVMIDAWKQGNASRAA